MKWNLIFIRFLSEIKKKKRNFQKDLNEIKKIKFRDLFKNDKWFMDLINKS